MIAMTRGFQELIARTTKGLEIFCQHATRLKHGKEPSMVVGRPSAENIGRTYTEDDERTLVVNIPGHLPKVYSCLNETGEATLMLAEDY